MESNKGGVCSFAVMFTHIYRNKDEEATKVLVLMDALSGVRILATQ